MTNVPAFLYAAQAFLLMALLLLCIKQMYVASHMLLFAAVAFVPIAAQASQTWWVDVFGLASVIVCTTLAMQSLIISTSPIISAQMDT